MVDNPKIFLISILIIILVFTGILGVIKINQAVEENLESGPYQPSIILRIDKFITSTGNIINKNRETSEKAPSLDRKFIPNYDVVVIYTDKGFSPGTIKIVPGQMVRFTNASSGTLKIRIPQESQFSAHPSFLDFPSLSTNKSHEILFSYSGSFVFESNINPSHSGVVIVE